MRVKCPTCHRQMQWSTENRYRPFCSERCRMVDLGAWLADERAIAGEPAAGPDGEATAMTQRPAED
jgi:uncharacterized protein